MVSCAGLTLNIIKHDDMPRHWWLLNNKHLLSCLKNNHCTTHMEITAMLQTVVCMGVWKWTSDEEVCWWENCRWKNCLIHFFFFFNRGRTSQTLKTLMVWQYLYLYIYANNLIIDNNQNKKLLALRFYMTWANLFKSVYMPLFWLYSNKCGCFIGIVLQLWYISHPTIQNVKLKCNRPICCKNGFHCFLSVLGYRASLIL